MNNDRRTKRIIDHILRVLKTRNQLTDEEYANIQNARRASDQTFNLVIYQIEKDTIDPDHPDELCDILFEYLDFRENLTNQNAPKSRVGTKMVVDEETGEIAWREYPIDLVNKTLRNYIDYKGNIEIEIAVKTGDPNEHLTPNSAKFLKTIIWNGSGFEAA